MTATADEPAPASAETPATSAVKVARAALTRREKGMLAVTAVSVFAAVVSLASNVSWGSSDESQPSAWCGEANWAAGGVQLYQMTFGAPFDASGTSNDYLLPDQPVTPESAATAMAYGNLGRSSLNQLISIGKMPADVNVSDVEKFMVELYKQQQHGVGPKHFAAQVMSTCASSGSN